MPAALKAPDQAGGRGGCGPYENERTPGGHEGIGLTGDYGTAGGGFLGHQAHVALAEVLGHGKLVLVRCELHIPGESDGFQTGPALTATGEDKTEAVRRGKPLHGGGNGFHVMGAAEVAGVE